MTQICRLCSSEKDLCDSHIIPEFVYKPVYLGPKEDRYTVGIWKGGKGDLRYRCRQRGLSEPLLCSSCEQFLNTSYEQPSVPLWRTLTEGAAPPRDIQVFQAQSTAGSLGLEIRGVNYQSWKLFLLSILWRAGIASAPEFRSVRLGPYEEKLRLMLLKGEPGRKADFPIVIWRLREPFKGMSWPRATRDDDGHRAYLGVLANLRIAFYVSGHVGQQITKLAVSEDGIFHVAEVDFDSLPDSHELRRLLREAGPLPDWVRGG